MSGAAAGAAVILLNNNTLAQHTIQDYVVGGIVIFSFMLILYLCVYFHEKNIDKILEGKDEQERF